MAKKSNSWIFSVIFILIVSYTFYIIAKMFMKSVSKEKTHVNGNKYEGTKVKEPYMI